MTRSYHLTSVRIENMIYIGAIFADGSKRELGRFELPNDGQWRIDVDFIDDIVDAYKKRYKKII